MVYVTIIVHRGLSNYAENKSSDFYDVALSRDIFGDIICTIGNN